MAFGAFVEILAGKDGLVHISEMAEGHIDRVEDVVNVGDKVKVRVIEIDNLGRINLSMREAGGDGAVGLSDEQVDSTSSERSDRNDQRRDFDNPNERSQNRRNNQPQRRNNDRQRGGRNRNDRPRRNDGDADSGGRRW